MIFKHFIGVITFRAEGDNSLRFLNTVRDSNFKCTQMYCKNNDVYGKIYGTNIKKLNDIASEYHMKVREIKKQGLIYKILPYKKRFGIVLGIIFSIAIIFFLSNTTLKIRVIGCDEAIYQDILSVLQENGVEAGKFIPSMDFDKIERNIITKLKDVSWISIRSSGGIITVNISQTDKKPEIVPRRLPCNIISTKDAQIKKVQVYAGQLMVLIGDGVKKGDLLVSGFVVDKNGKATYYYAQGEIIGEYEEEINFTQPLSEEVKIISTNSETRNYFNFFSCKIPMYIGKKIKGEYSYNERTNYFSLFTLKLPIGITHCSYQPYKYKIIDYSNEEAKNEINEKILKYENNFLKNCVILDKRISESITEFDVTYKVTYKLHGDITETSEILSKN